MKKLKALLSTVLVGGLLLTLGFTNVYAEEGEEISELEGIVEKISPLSIPLDINLSPQNVNKSGVTSHTVSPRINWYDGVSNSFHVSYTNAHGQLQLSQTFYNYSVDIASTTYNIPSGGTRFEGNHYASVSSNTGLATTSGTIILNLR